MPIEECVTPRNHSSYFYYLAALPFFLPTSGFLEIEDRRVSLQLLLPISAM